MLFPRDKTLKTKGNPATPSLPRGPRLHSVGAVQREIAHVYRRARRGEIDPGEACRLGYLLFNLVRVIDSHDIERRICALERRA